MVETKSLLRQIRDKETNLSDEMDRAAREAEQFVEAAKKEAEAIIRGAEAEGQAIAAEHLRAVREKLDGEITEMRARGLIDAAAVRKRAEGRIPRAVERITKAVALR